MYKHVTLIIAVLTMVFLGTGHVFAQLTPEDAQVAAQGCTIRTDWPTYTVQRGDTLYNISRRAGTTVDVLRAGNCLTGNLIVVGTTLRVPNAITDPDAGPMIDIQQPGSGATLTPGQPFTVSGQARALFEGSLVVQVHDSASNIMAQNVVTAGGDVGVGGTGPWSTSFTITVPVGTSATIYAYATSARDGGVVAEDQVNVTFGGGTGDDGPMIDIQQPGSGATLTPGQPFTVSGQARALFEGNLVVQVRDSGGNVLAETPVTAGGDVAVGGTGPWSTSFTITVPTGTPATIYAYATSARDGSVVAEDQVSVTFGTPADCTVRSDWPVHVVRRGENLFRIGLRYNVTVTTLARANCLESPGRIYAGQRLHVPAF